MSYLHCQVFQFCGIEAYVEKSHFYLIFDEKVSNLKKTGASQELHVSVMYHITQQQKRAQVGSVTHADVGLH